jgi:Ca2+-binding EF-hand superfamily protein
MSFKPPPLKKFTKAELDALEEKFIAADTDKSGGISQDEAVGLWQACGLDMVWLGVAYGVYDENRNGELEWDEFVKFFEMATACQESGDLGSLEQQIFDELAEGKGEISILGVSILRAIRNLFLGTPEKDFSEDEATDFVEQFGTDGVVSFDQWLRGIAASP